MNKIFPLSLAVATALAPLLVAAPAQAQSFSLGGVGGHVNISDRGVGVSSQYGSASVYDGQTQVNAYHRGGSSSVRVNERGEVQNVSVSDARSGAYVNVPVAEYSQPQYSRSEQPSEQPQEYQTYYPQVSPQKYQEENYPQQTVRSRVIIDQPVQAPDYSRQDYSRQDLDPAKRYYAPTQITTNTVKVNSVGNGGGNVTESGQRPYNIQLAGWANDMPLSLAVRQVVPSDFSVLENGVPMKRNVSWSGDKPWFVTLDELSRQGDFMAHIDWNKKEVSLAPAFVSKRAISQTAPAPTPPVISEVRQQVIIQEDSSLKDNPYSKDGSYANNRVIKASTNVVQTQVQYNMSDWTLDPKLTLRENVEAWSSRAGWRVVWDGADYPIVAPATFSGTFAAPDGPVAKLIAAYETSDQPLVANLTTMDKVIHVKNKYYENQEVAPTSASEISSELFADPKK